MRFIVPQFIEHEARIVGPLTLKQFLLIAIPASISFFLYFFIGQTNFFVFFVLSLIMMVTGASLAFMKVSGQGLPSILVNFFLFNFSPKLYVWKRKESSITFSKKAEMKKRGEAEDNLLKITKDSQIKRLKTHIETKN